MKFCRVHSVLFVAGSCASLQTVVSERSGETSCVGDTVTYTCNIAGSFHIWRISLLQNAFYVTIDLRTSISPPYLIEVVSDNGVDMVTVSRLTLTSFRELNGVTIRCIATGNREIQETTAMVGESISIASIINSYSVTPLM